MLIPASLEWQLLSCCNLQSLNGYQTLSISTAWQFPPFLWTPFVNPVGFLVKINTLKFARCYWKTVKQIKILIGHWWVLNGYWWVLIGYWWYWHGLDVGAFVQQTGQYCWSVWDAEALQGRVTGLGQLKRSKSAPEITLFPDCQVSALSIKCIALWYIHL